MELGESNNFHQRVLVRMKGVFRQDLVFTKTQDILAKEDLMTLTNFKELFYKVKEVNKRVQALPNNTQAVMSTFNDTKVLHKSVSAVAKWLENETGKSCSRQTLTNKYLDKDIKYEGYKLERVQLDHPGFITSESKSR
jgi:hypothetical protein